MKESTSRKIKHICVGGKERLSAESSDGEGHKAVVLLNVSLQDVRAGTQDPLEPRPVQFHTLQWSTCDDSGGTRPVHQQGDLTWKPGIRSAWCLRPNRF